MSFLTEIVINEFSNEFFNRTVINEFLNIILIKEFSKEFFIRIVINESSNEFSNRNLNA